MFGRKGRELESELVKLSGFFLNLPRFRFIRSYKNRFSDISQKNRYFFVERRYAGTRINHPYNRLCLFDSKSGLFEDVCGYDRLIIRNYPASIYELESFGSPFDIPVNSVTRNPRLVADDRFTRSGKSVEQGRFTDVRPANYSY
jgi:hypothetical protein